MRDRRAELIPFFGSSSPDRRSTNPRRHHSTGRFHDQRSPSQSPACGRLVAAALKASEYRSRATRRVRDLNDLYFVVHLDQLAPVGRRAASGRKRRRLERLAKMHENLPDVPWIGDEGDHPNVAATVRAQKWKLLTNSGDQIRRFFGLRNYGNRFAEVSPVRRIFAIHSTVWQLQRFMLRCERPCKLR